MAHIEKWALKKGGYSFRITVLHHGIKHRKTVTVSADLTERQAEKEVGRIAAQYEEEIRSGLRLNYSITLRDWIDELLQRKTASGRKKKTLSGYRFCARRIIEFWPDRKLIDIGSTELATFFSWLSRECCATATRYVKRENIDLTKIMQDEQHSRSSLAAAAGISRSTVRSAIDGNNITQNVAQQIADALAYRIEELFLENSVQDKLSAESVNNYRRFLSIIFSSAVKEGIILQNPLVRLERPMVERKEKTSLQPDEIQAILSAVEQEPLDKQCLIHLFLITGCRRGEIAGMQWQWISWERSTVRIVNTIQYTPEDGVYEDSAKTRQTRLIRLPDATMQLLSKHFDSAGKPKTGYIFCNRQGGPISPETINSYIRRFRKKYGLAEIHPHIFRHTMASILLYAGQDIVSVSKRLGHANVTTTQNIYSHLIEKADVESAEIIAEALLLPSTTK